MKDYNIYDNINFGVLIINKDMNIMYTNKYINNYLNFHKIEKQDNIKKYLYLIENKNLDCELNNLLNKIDSEYVYKINKELFKIYKIYHNKNNHYIFMFHNINSDESSSSFLAKFNHELRTPLNGIIGMITLLEDTKLNNIQVDYVSMLKECSINLLSIINDILDYSKLESGNVKLELKCSNLRKSIESVNDILTSKLYEKQNIEYNFYIDENLSDNIIIDSTRVKQVLLNLLSNAIKFTNKGNISLNVIKIKHKYTGKYKIEFIISDTGCGIDEYNQVRLFNPFVQFNEMNKGTGLGLVICKQLIDLMGGKLWLDSSDKDKGSCFKFHIDLVECNNCGDFNHTLNYDNNYKDLLVDKNVLILDDNRENRISLSNTIIKWGMKPFPFYSAIEALHMSSVNIYDIGLIDASMPEMSGINFAKRLKEQGVNIPLILLSSYNDLNEQYKLYFDGYLLKPYKEQKLKELCLNNLVNVRRSLNKIMHEELNRDLKDDIHILLVEDIHINQKVVLKFLNKLNFKNIDIADDGKKCLKMMSNYEYDIILLDIKMPILDGDLVCKYILEYYKLNSLEKSKKEYILKNKKKPYLVAVTAYSLKEDREKYLSIGFDDYIPKPINIKYLDECMSNFIKKLLYN